MSFNKFFFLDIANMGRIKEIDVLLKTYNIVPTAYTAPQNAEASRMNIAYNLRPTTTAQLDYCPPSKRKYLDVSQSNVPSSTARTEKRRKFSPKVFKCCCNKPMMEF